MDDTIGELAKGGKLQLRVKWLLKILSLVQFSVSARFSCRQIQKKTWQIFPIPVIFRTYTLTYVGTCSMETICWESSCLSLCGLCGTFRIFEFVARFTRYLYNSTIRRVRSSRQLLAGYSSAWAWMNYYHRIRKLLVVSIVDRVVALMFSMFLHSRS